MGLCIKCDSLSRTDVGENTTGDASVAALLPAPTSWRTGVWGSEERELRDGDV